MIMAEASFSSVLRTLLIIILVFYALKFLFRLLAPYIFQQVVKKAGENFQQQQQNMYERQQQQQYAQAPEKPKEKKKVGEYIDYEELE